MFFAHLALKIALVLFLQSLHLIPSSIVLLQSLHFTIPKADFNGYVYLDDSWLVYDNYYYFSISKPEKTNVLAIGQVEKNQFLTKIYTENEFIFSQFELKSLDYNLLEKQDAVILNELKENHFSF